MRIAGTALAFLTAAIGFGSLLARIVRIEDFWEDLAARAVIGLSILYAIFVALGSAGAFKLVPIGVVVLVGFCLGVGFGKDLLLKAVPPIKDLPNWKRLDQFLLGGIAVLCLLQLLFALAPLIFYDSLVYQLSVPAQFIRNGGFTPVPWNFFAHSPMALQITLGASWAVDRSGDTFKFLLALLGLLTPLAASLIVKAGRTASLLTALFVLSFPEFWVHQALGVVDLSVAAFLLLGVYWMRQALQEHGKGLTILVGAAFGLVIASRYQGIVLVAWFMAAIVVERILVSGWRSAFPTMRSAFAVGAIASLMVLPWLIRNWMQAGNPFYPMFIEQLGGTEWSPVQGELLRRDVFGPSFLEVSALQKLLAPVALLLRPASSGFWGLAVLLCALAATVWRSNREVRPIAIMGLGGLVLWGVIHPRADVVLVRFNAASLAVLLAVTAVVLSRRFVWQGIGVVLALCSVVAGVRHANAVVPVWDTVGNPLARTAYVRTLITSMEGFRFLNEHLDVAKDKVLLIGETRTLWIDAPVLAATAFNGPQITELFATGTSEEWLTRVRGLGISHILVNHPELERLHTVYGYLDLSPERLEAVYDWLHSLPVAFSNEKGTAVLAIRPNDENPAHRAAGWTQ